MSGTGLAALLLAGGGGLLLAAGLAGDGGERLVARRLRRLAGREPAAGEPRPRRAPWVPGEGGLLFLRAELEPRRFLTATLGGGAVAATLGFGLGGPAWLAAGLLPAAAGGLVLRHRIRRRQAALEAALPAFLDRLCQQLLVGASLPQALQRAVAASPPIVQWVFQPAERRLQLGEPLVDTLEWTALRHGGTDLAALASVMGAATRFGGRLAETLRGLAAMMRDRQRIARELASATAEVRTSSFVLGGLPPAVAAGLAVLSPDFVDYFADPGRGQGMLMASAGLYLLGLLLLRQIAQPRF
jgi:tight adherence protein B